MTKISLKKEFGADYITRAAGERLRTRILEAYKKKESVEIDFSGLTIGSTSFFDEGIAKLVDEGWDTKTIEKTLTFKGLHRLDREVLIQVCKYRGLDLK